MTVPAVHAARLPWSVAAELLLVVCSPALSLAGVPGAALPLAVTIFLVVAAALVLAAADSAPGLEAEVASCTALFEARSPARQCDPDAAGHVRSRAPGRRVSVTYC